MGGSLIPDIGNLNANTFRSMNSYLQAAANTSNALMKPIEVLNSQVQYNENQKDNQD